jgi:hypothetical protein
MRWRPSVTCFHHIPLKPRQSLKTTVLKRYFVNLITVGSAVTVPNQDYVTLKLMLSPTKDKTPAHWVLSDGVWNADEKPPFWGSLYPCRLKRLHATFS